MFRRGSVLVLLALACSALVLAGCGGGKSPAAGKIAITTSSKEARAAYLQGRDLFERLRVQNSLEHYQKAAELDPGFALAELGIANAVPTTREGFEHMKKAVSLADKASAGERLLILANDAAFNGNAAKQKEYLDQLVAAAPNDERAQFNLGVYYYGQEDYPAAIACLKKATELAPDYSPSYNILGYAYRETGSYPESEQAFKKYIQLIPDDPNPYDSDAELLLKMGRFDESIAAYRKALSFDSNFVSSHVGVATAQLYQGQSAEAMKVLGHLYDISRNDGERRNALFAMAVVEADGGHLPAALEQVKKEYAIAAQTSDLPSMAGDLRTQGAILVEMGKLPEAQAAFDQALKMVEDSELGADVKSNAALLHDYDAVTVALGRKQLDAAKTGAAELQKTVAPLNNPALTRLTHQAAGMVALAAKDWPTAIAELKQADPLNAYNLYRLAVACQASGDRKAAQDYCTQVTRFNSIPALNYAFVRARAGKMIKTLKG